MSRSTPEGGLLRPTSVREAERRIEYGIATRGLAAELEAAGFAVERLGDLRRTSAAGGRRALPILLRWLAVVEDRDLTIDLAACLATPWAAPDALAPLVATYRRHADPAGARVRAAVATTLQLIADDSIADDLLDLARDPTHGVERGMLVIALGNLREHRDRAVATLVELLDDEPVTLFAVLGLAKADASEAALAVLGEGRHRHPLVRQVARETGARLLATRHTAVRRGSPRDRS